MKLRSLIPEELDDTPLDALCRALMSLETLAQFRAFLRDLCTPAELESLTDRWRVVPYLLEGLAYREIHDRTAVSVTTIGRVARFLSQGNGGYRAAVGEGALPPIRKRGRTPGKRPAARSTR
jgi:TrpR-related protein YerC/YecD